MKKTLALLLVASLLLAGCTELAESEDGETLKIEINEDIAIEEIKDFMTVDEGESFGITMMYDMDPGMMGMGDMIEVDEDSEAIITIEMTEAWSPDGYYTSEIMGLSNGDSSMKMISSMTHIDTTIHFEVGYETQGDLCADEETQEEKEMCEMMYGDMPLVQMYSMTTTTTHTEVIAAMADETQDNTDDMDPMEMLSFLSFVECYGSFTPAESVDGLQIFDVSMDGMNDDAPSPEMALCVADIDGSGGVSFEEFMTVDETEQDSMTAMQTAFDDADADADGELTVDELGAFIEAVDEYYGHDDDHGDDDDHDDGDGDEMPAMKIAFNNAGEIEYFEMAMDEMGEELTVMKMYVLTDDRVNSLFTGVDAGEVVALPFTITDELDPWGSDDQFICDDGESIPMDYVNDGMEDCSGGEDEDSMGEDEFTCDDGFTIPMDWVNDGVEDCTNGEDEDGMDDDEMWTFYREFTECDTDENMLINYDELQYCVEMDLANDGYDMDVDDIGLQDLFDFADDDVDENLSEDEFDYIYLVLSGLSDDDYEDMIFYDGCTESSDPDDSPLECWMNDWLDSDGEIMMSDGYEIEDCTELSDNTGWECIPRGEEPTWVEITFICGDGTEIPFDYVNDDEADCADGADEQQYDSDGNEINWFDCMDGSQVWISQVNDGAEDCPDGDDEMLDMDDDHDDGDDHGDHDDHGDDHGDHDDHGDDHGDHDDHGDDHDDHDHGEEQGDDSDEMVFYIESELDFVEGDMSDYKIELASCDYDYDMDTGEETKTCTSQMSITISDAEMDSTLMFHDADSSGTISAGDMIHIGETDVDWDEVRLYSISADAYSDENPMHDAPGFTGIVGMLALLGAAFIRRNE